MFDLARCLLQDAAPVCAGPCPDAPLPQSRLWAGAVRLLGADLVPVTTPGLRGFAIRREVAVVGPVAMISRGPPGLCRPAQVAGLRRDLGARHLVIHAETPAQGDLLAAAGFRRFAAPRRVAELRLDPSPDAMARRMSGRWRNRLRHALRGPLVVSRRPFRPDRRHWLLRAEAEAARGLGYRPLPPAMICALAATQLGAAQLFTAHHCGRRVAAMLMLRHGRVATYQIGWSTAEGRALSAGNALMWQAMLSLGAMGVTRLDLGAADAATAPGLARFKRGTGAETRPLGGSWVESALLPRRAARHRTAFETPEDQLPALGARGDGLM